MFKQIMISFNKWTCRNCGRSLPFGGELCALCGNNHAHV